MRQDPRSGALFLAYVSYPEEGEPYVQVASRR